MNVLSVEEKAQRYDEAIEKFYAMLRSDAVNKSVTTLVSDVKKILSELTENMDERIRRAIKSVVSDNVGSHKIYGVSKGDMIVWLEKHSEPMEISTGEFNSRLNILLKQFASLPTKELTCSLSFYRDIIQKDGTYKAEPMRVKFNPGERKLVAVKCLKQNLNLGLKEAKDCVDNREFECTKEQYLIIKALLISAGAYDFYIKD